MAFKPGRKPTKLSLILGLILGIVAFSIYLILISYLMMPSKACPADEIKGKSNQEVADILGYPLITLGQLPSGVSDEPLVVALTDFPDRRCFLYVRYGPATQQNSPLEIMVVISPDQRDRAEEDWECLDDPTLNFVTTCNKTIKFAQKYYDVSLETQYSLAETQDLAAYVVIS